MTASNQHISQEIEEAQARLWDFIHEEDDPEAYDQANADLDIIYSALLGSLEQYGTLREELERVRGGRISLREDQIGSWAAGVLLMAESNPAIVQDAAGENPDAAGGNSGRSAPSPASKPLSDEDINAASRRQREAMRREAQSPANSHVGAGTEGAVEAPYGGGGASLASPPRSETADEQSPASEPKAS